MRDLILTTAILGICINSSLANEIDGSVEPYISAIEQQLYKHGDNLCRVSLSFPISKQQCAEECEKLQKVGLITIAKLGEPVAVEQYVLTELGRRAYDPTATNLKNGLASFCFGTIKQYQVVTATAMDSLYQTTVSYKVQIADPQPALYDLSFTNAYALPNLTKDSTESTMMQKVVRVSPRGEVTIVK